MIVIILGFVFILVGVYAFSKIIKKVNEDMQKIATAATQKEQKDDTNPSYDIQRVIKDSEKLSNSITEAIAGGTGRRHPAFWDD